MLKRLSLFCLCLFFLLVQTSSAHPGHSKKDHVFVKLSKSEITTSLTSSKIKEKKGLYSFKVNNKTFTTHGPDPRPVEGTVYDEYYEENFQPGDPERDPVCAKDYYQEIVYAYPKGQSRYNQVAEDIRDQVKRSNYVLNQNSLRSGGGEIDYKVKCDSLNRIKISSFSFSGKVSFGNLVTEMREQGFYNDGGKADYSVFVDGQADYCGVANYVSDPRPGPENFNNVGTGYAFVTEPCWNTIAYMHENGHNQGAVANEAPHSTGGGHCWDEYDVMCYSPDGGSTHQQGIEVFQNCNQGYSFFDCNYNDYFSTNPNVDNYLKNHWNLGSGFNRFLDKEDKSDLDNDSLWDFEDPCPYVKGINGCPPAKNLGAFGINKGKYTGKETGKIGSLGTLKYFNFKKKKGKQITFQLRGRSSTLLLDRRIPSIEKSQEAFKIILGKNKSGKFKLGIYTWTGQGGNKYSIQKKVR